MAVNCDPWKSTVASGSQWQTVAVISGLWQSMALRPWWSLVAAVIHKRIAFSSIWTQLHGSLVHSLLMARWAPYAHALFARFPRERGGSTPPHAVRAHCQAFPAMAPGTIPQGRGGSTPTGFEFHQSRRIEDTKGISHTKRWSMQIAIKGNLRCAKRIFANAFRTRLAKGTLLFFAAVFSGQSAHAGQQKTRHAKCRKIFLKNILGQKPA